MKKGRLIVISGPSGSGKTTICEKLLKALPDMEYSISFTTRKPRRGEKDGKDYFFVSDEEFQKRIKENLFLEYAQVFGNYYGTSKNWVLEKLNAGRDILLSLDVQGAARIKKNFPDAVLIFLMPPSLKVLEERLKKRATDEDKEVSKRLTIAKDEMAEVGNYNYVVINDKVEEAVAEIKNIIRNER